MKLDGKIVIWPANLDSTKTRKKGRKIPKGLAVQAPRLSEMEQATKRLSLNAEITVGKSRPSTWWEKGGFLVVPRKEGKTDLLRALASEIRKIRAAGSDREKAQK